MWFSARTTAASASARALNLMNQKVSPESLGCLFAASAAAIPCDWAPHGGLPEGHGPALGGHHVLVGLSDPGRASITRRGARMQLPRDCPAMATGISRLYVLAAIHCLAQSTCRCAY